MPPRSNRTAAAPPSVPEPTEADLALDHPPAGRRSAISASTISAPEAYANAFGTAIPAPPPAHERYAVAQNAYMPAEPIFSACPSPPNNGWAWNADKDSYEAVGDHRPTPVPAASLGTMDSAFSTMEALAGESHVHRPGSVHKLCGNTRVWGPARVSKRGDGFMIEVGGRQGVPRLCLQQGAPRPAPPSMACRSYLRLGMQLRRLARSCWRCSCRR
jgi:hypothetical protein